MIMLMLWWLILFCGILAMVTLARFGMFAPEIAAGIAIFLLGYVVMLWCPSDLTMVSRFYDELTKREAFLVFYGFLASAVIPVVYLIARGQMRQGEGSAAPVILLGTVLNMMLVVAVFAIFPE